MNNDRASREFGFGAGAAWAPEPGDGPHRVRVAPLSLFPSNERLLLKMPPQALGRSVMASLVPRMPLMSPAEVWTRPWVSVSGTRCIRWTPLSNFSRPNTQDMCLQRRMASPDNVSRRKAQFDIVRRIGHSS